MTHVDQTSIDSRRSLASLYAPVEPELGHVERWLQRELHSDQPAIEAVIRHGIQVGGKRLRPALLLLAGRSVGRLREAHVVLATVVELIHTATLVHDDVLDEAVLRRHMPTVNARWNNETSVLLGDLLFSHAFHLASTLDSTYACRRIGAATKIICDGELRQTLASGDHFLSEDAYLAIVEAKTAELCACACELGAHYAGADDATADRLSAFGRNLGIAFQIADDLLDLEGNEAIAGKSLGTDLAKHKMTLPLIHARDALDGADRSAFLALLAHPPLPSRDGQALLLPAADGEGVLHHRPGQFMPARSPAATREIIAWLGRNNSLAYARAQAQFYAREAQAQVSDLPDGPAKESLAAVADFVVSRHA